MNERRMIDGERGARGDARDKRSTSGVKGMACGCVCFTFIYNLSLVPIIIQ